MESRIDPAAQSQDHQALVSIDNSHAAPFAQEWVTLTKQQFIELEASVHYWQAQHSRAKARIETLEEIGLPIAPGTLASRLPALAPLLEPVVQALYRRPMTETVFHNDETRWEVFEAMEGKVGSRWYLWVTRSDSVVYFCLDPSRSAAVPGAHFAGLTAEQVIIVCDRYSAYKKLARLSGNIVLAFCWAHVRRDFLEAGSAMAELEAWALDWKARIGQLYALNRERLAHWQTGCPLTEQNAAFQHAHQALNSALQGLQKNATQALDAPVEKKPAGTTVYAAPLSKSARNRQHKVYRSLLAHWSGLIRFIDHPEVPMDNNKAENSLRHSVVGRNNYYGSGSVASAELTALLFTLLRTLVLWGINPRQWLTDYLNTCAALGGKAPDVIDGYLPWQRPEATKPGKQAAPPTPSSSNTTRAPPPTRH